MCHPQLGEGRCDISLAKSGKVCASSKYDRARGRFFLQENTLSSKFVGLNERSPKLVLKFFSDKVRG